MTMLYDGWLKIREARHQGRRFEILEDKEAAGALVLDQEGKILLVRQHRVPLGRDSLEIPAGCLDKDGLTPAEVMAEELEEEAHLTVPAEELKELLTILPSIGVSKSRYILYAWRYPALGENKAITGDDDVAERLWLSPEDFGKRIREGEIMDAKSVLAYYYLLAHPEL